MLASRIYHSILRRANKIVWKAIRKTQQLSWMSPQYLGMLNPAFLFHNSIVHGNVFLRHAYKTGSAVKLPDGRFNNFECQTATSHADISFRQTTKVSANISARSTVIPLLYLIRNCKTEQLVGQSLEIAPALLIINQKT